MTECLICQRTAHLVAQWLAAQRHDRCWYYPDIFQQLAALHGVEAPIPLLPPRREFEEGCRQYADEQYGARPGPPPIPGFYWDSE